MRNEAIADCQVPNPKSQMGGPKPEIRPFLLSTDSCTIILRSDYRSYLDSTKMRMKHENIYRVCGMG